MIAVTCRCGRSFRAPDSAAGKRGKCPLCHAVIDVPTFVGNRPVGQPSRAVQPANTPVQPANTLTHPATPDPSLLLTPVFVPPASGWLTCGVWALVLIVFAGLVLATVAAFGFANVLEFFGGFFRRLAEGPNAGGG